MSNEDTLMKMLGICEKIQNHGGGLDKQVFAMKQGEALISLAQGNALCEDAKKGASPNGAESRVEIKNPRFAPRGLRPFRALTSAWLNVGLRGDAPCPTLMMTGFQPAGRVA